MSATSKTGRATLVAANGRARRPAEPPQGDLSHAEALRGRERRDFKPTGVCYLPAMPCNWEIKKAKVLFRQEKRPVRSDDGVVTCFRDGQVTLRANRRTEGFTNSLKEIGYQGVRKGDLVIHNMDAFAGSVGVSESDGKMSPVCSICTPLRDDVDVRFYALILRVLAYTGFIKSLAKGIRERSTDFRFSDFRELLLPLPPLPEQKAIVAYLDAETGRIDKAIAAEEKMIALLQERREIVINEAVGGGDLSHAEAQRGRERRGWEVRRLSQVILSLRTGLNPRRFFELNPDNATNYYVTIRELRNGKIVFSKDTDRINDQALSLCKNRSRLEKGDILFSGTGSIGEVALVRESPTNWNIKEGIYALKPNCKRIHTKYLVYVLVSPAFLALARARAVGTAVRSIPMKDLAILPIPLPPLPEQEAIVERLDRETGKIDRAIEVKRRQIELLRERRQIVIDEVVTGKVKVA